MAGFDGDDGPEHDNTMRPTGSVAEAAELNDEQREVVASYNRCAQRARDDAHKRLKATLSSQRALALSASALPGGGAALAGGFDSPFDARVAALVQRWGGAVPNFDGDIVGKQRS